MPASSLPVVVAEDMHFVDFDVNFVDLGLIYVGFLLERSEVQVDFFLSHQAEREVILSLFAHLAEFCDVSHYIIHRHDLGLLFCAHDVVADYDGVYQAV